MADMTPRRLNDEQLRDAELTVSDPLSVKGLRHEKPNTEYPPVIVAEYHLTKDNQVRCSHCEQRQVHQHGFVAEFAPGSRHLIGSACGQMKLGFEFNAARGKHKDLRSRQSYLRRLDFVIAHADAIITQCDAVLRMDALREVENVAKALDDHAGDMMFRLRANNGDLVENVRVRDLAAETEEDEKKGRRRYTMERRSIGQLRGRGIIRAGGIRPRIKKLKDAVRGVRALGRSLTDDLQTRELKAAIQKLDNAYEDANAAIAEINRAPLFFNKENLTLIERWARGNTSVVVEADATTLIVNSRRVTLEPFSALSSIADLKP